MDQGIKKRMKQYIDFYDGSSQLKKSLRDVKGFVFTFYLVTSLFRTTLNAVGTNAAVKAIIITTFRHVNLFGGPQPLKDGGSMERAL